MNRRTFVESSIKTMLASVMVPSLPLDACAASDILPLTLYYDLGTPHGSNAKFYIDIHIDEAAFKLQIERLRGELERGAISKAEIERRIEDGTMVNMVRRTIKRA